MKNTCNQVHEETQRRLNPEVVEAFKEEILKWLHAEIVYLIFGS